MGRDECLLGKERKYIFGTKSQLWKRRTLFLKLLCVASVMCWELLAKIIVDTPYTRINSKQIQCLNIESKTIKLLQENIGGGGGGRFKTLDFLDMTPKVQAKKENR